MKKTKKLKQKIFSLENEIEYLKRDKKSNNIVIFGLEESEKSQSELLQNVKEIFHADLNLTIRENDFNKLYRIGKNNSENKTRPILFY